MTASADWDNDISQGTDKEALEGYMLGYTPTLEELRLQEVYGAWAHTNDGGHLSGGVMDDTI